MAATAHKCGAGLLACVAFGALILADTRAEVLDLFASMTAALSDDNVPGFMAGFDRDMPDYGKLKTQITALVDEADLGSDIEPVKDEGDDTRRSVDLDWFLVIRSSVPNGPTINRRQVIHCELRKEKRHWRIVAISPLEFFAPARFGEKSGQ